MRHLQFNMSRAYALRPPASSHDSAVKGYDGGNECSRHLAERAGAELALELGFYDLRTLGL